MNSLDTLVPTRTCRHCGIAIQALPVTRQVDSLVVWVAVDPETTADGLTYCPPDPDAAKVGDHRPAAA